MELVNFGKFFTSGTFILCLVYEIFMEANWWKCLYSKKTPLPSLFNMCRYSDKSSGIEIGKIIFILIRRGSRATATSKIERFVIIVNGFQPLTIITKRSILDLAAALDPPLVLNNCVGISFLRTSGGWFCNVRFNLLPLKTPFHSWKRKKHWFY